MHELRWPVRLCEHPVPSSFRVFLCQSLLTDLPKFSITLTVFDHKSFNCQKSSSPKEMYNLPEGLAPRAQLPQNGALPQPACHLCVGLERRCVLPVSGSFLKIESEGVWPFVKLLWCAVAAREYWKASSGVICFGPHDDAIFYLIWSIFLAAHVIVQETPASLRRASCKHKCFHLHTVQPASWRSHRFNYCPGFRLSVAIQFKTGIPTPEDRFTICALCPASCCQYITADWLAWRSMIIARGKGSLTSYSWRAP